MKLGKDIVIFKYVFLLVVAITLLLANCIPVSTQSETYVRIIVETPTPIPTYKPTENIEPVESPISVSVIDVAWSISAEDCKNGNIQNASVKLNISGGEPPYSISPPLPIVAQPGERVQVTVSSSDGQSWVGEIRIPNLCDQLEPRQTKTPSSSATINSPTNTLTSTQSLAPTITFTPTLTTTPTAAASGNYSGKIVLVNVDLGTYLVEAPKIMTLGESQEIRAQVYFDSYYLHRIKKSIEMASAEYAATPNVKYFIEIGTTKGVVPSVVGNLVITNFDVDESVASEKSLISNTKFEWTWILAPTKLGMQKVSLVFLMPVKDVTGDSQLIVGEVSMGINVVAPEFTPTPMSPWGQRVGNAFTEKLPDVLGYLLTFFAAILAIILKDEAANKRKTKRSISKSNESKTSKPRKKEAKKFKTES